jgi:hypothetical protein
MRPELVGHSPFRESAPSALGRMFGYVKPDVEALRAELKKLLASWEYAFAMGHSCTLGDHPDHRAVRRRVADLRALLAEHGD